MIKNFSLYIFFTVSMLISQKQYSDLNAMLNEVEPFQDQINESDILVDSYSLAENTSTDISQIFNNVDNIRNANVKLVSALADIGKNKIKIKIK